MQCQEAAFGYVFGIWGLDYNLFKNVDERMIDELRKNMPELRYVSLGMLFGDKNS